jgi:hypothetical protein
VIASAPDHEPDVRETVRLGTRAADRIEVTLVLPPPGEERDGVQRIDAFTDPLGRRRLERVEVGSVVLLAGWGGRQVRETVEVREGGLVRVRLVPR